MCYPSMKTRRAGTMSVNLLQFYFILLMSGGQKVCTNKPDVSLRSREKSDGPTLPDRYDYESKFYL